jgi:hypothetical protein
MKLCDDHSPARALEDMTHLVRFLGETLCAARDVELSESAQCGAFAVFWALAADMEELREKVIALP